MCAYGLPHLADLGAIDDRGFVSPPAPSHTLPSQWSLPPREWKWHFIPLRCVEWRCCAPPLSKTGGVTKTMRTMDCRSPSVALSVRLHVTRTPSGGNTSGDGRCRSAPLFVRTASARCVLWRSARAMQCRQRAASWCAVWSTLRRTEPLQAAALDDTAPASSCRRGRARGARRCRAQRRAR